LPPIKFLLHGIKFLLIKILEKGNFGNKKIVEEVVRLTKAAAYREGNR
jgi:hypothetical protein